MTNNREAHDQRQDNYALDDTLAGRITQAAAVGIATSYPDWIKSKGGLITAYTLSFFGFSALVAYTNAHAEQDGDEPRSPQDSDDQGLKPWAIFAAVVLLLILGGWMNVALSRRMVKFLRKRGAKRPWTLLGAIGAALTFLISELEARDIAKLAS